jgi:hypothetical protein
MCCTSGSAAEASIARLFTTPVPLHSDAFAPVIVFGERLLSTTGSAMRLPMQPGPSFGKTGSSNTYDPGD